MRKVQRGDCTIIYGAMDANVSKKVHAPLGMPAQPDFSGCLPKVGSGALNEVGSDVGVGVDRGVVVPFSPYRLASLFDSPNSLPASLLVTDDQLRDVYLLMVAEMLGMTCGSRGRYY